MNTFMPYKAPAPDGIYPICSQKVLDLIIKYLIKIYRGSVAVGHIQKPWKDIRVAWRIPSPHKPLIFMLKTLENFPFFGIP